MVGDGWGGVDAHWIPSLPWPWNNENKNTDPSSWDTAIRESGKLAACLAFIGTIAASVCVSDVELDKDRVNVNGMTVGAGASGKKRYTEVSVATVGSAPGRRARGTVVGGTRKVFRDNVCGG